MTRIAAMGVRSLVFWISVEDINSRAVARVLSSKHDVIAFASGCESIDAIRRGAVPTWSSLRVSRR